MEPINSFLRRPKPVRAANSERAELIGYFTDEVNKERDGKKWKKLTPRYIAVKLAHLSKSDLYYLKNQAKITTLDTAASQNISLDH